jgi:uncharacterized membrane protein HdeD (DUF308 family)
MRDSEIPPSIKSPLSLQADYADPKLYGYASMFIGIIALIAGIFAMVFVSIISGVLVCAMGAFLTIAGYVLVKRGE